MSAGLEMGAAVLRAMSKPLKWWIVIAEWEQGLRVRLGKHSDRLTPGVHLRIPWLDRIYVQSDRLRTMTSSGITGRSKDGKTIVFELAMHFSVANIKTLYMSLDDPEQTIRSYAHEMALEFIESANAADITASSLTQAVKFCATQISSWGLSDMSFTVTSLTTVRAYRLISNAYQTGTGMSDLEHGERK